MAANTRDIRRRIKSVKNTSQITKAMQMVAAAKMRKAQNAALAGRSYADLLRKVLASLGGLGEDETHELLQTREVKKELVLLISTDKGLCGALNTNLFREAAKFDPATTVFVCIGRKGLQYLTRGQRQVLADFNLKENFHFLEAKQASKFCMDKFIDGEVDKVTVCFTDFVNTLTQIPRTQVLLPISSLEVRDVLSSSETKIEAAPKDTANYVFEPNASAVLGGVLPHYVHFQVYQMILDCRASEHSARMVAMKNATDNAKQLIKDLTLEYNKVRQAAITTEILEISTAQIALG
ncbi:MAG: ATP synthase F1 subunit gamma [Chthoniobacteraceae bacterium]